SCSSSGSRPDSSRYSCTAFEPGASEVLTHGLRVSPLALALRAIRPAAITLRGLEVLVQLVIAAMITAPSGIRPCASSTLPDSSLPASAMPRSASALVGRRRCGLDGPAMLRTTEDRSKCRVRAYCACARSSAHRPAALA